MYPNSESTRQKDQSTSTGDKCGFIKILNPLTSTNADGSAFLNILSIAKPFDWSFFLNSSTSISASFSVSCGKINENRDNSDSLLLTLFTRFTEIWLLKSGLLMYVSGIGPYLLGMPRMFLLPYILCKPGHTANDLRVLSLYKPPKSSSGKSPKPRKFRLTHFTICFDGWYSFMHSLQLQSSKVIWLQKKCLQRWR